MQKSIKALYFSFILQVSGCGWPCLCGTSCLRSLLPSCQHCLHWFISCLLASALCKLILSLINFMVPLAGVWWPDTILPWEVRRKRTKQTYVFTAPQQALVWSGLGKAETLPCFRGEILPWNPCFRGDFYFGWVLFVCGGELVMSESWCKDL